VVLFCLAFLRKNKEALALCIEPTGWRRALFKCSSGGGGGSFQAVDSSLFFFALKLLRLPLALSLAKGMLLRTPSAPDLVRPAAACSKRETRKKWQR
jgi:hypothetical protein